MNSIETLTQDIQSAVSGNKIYDSYITVWRYLLESYTGGEEYRNAGHLTRYQLETDSEYRARLRATPLDNHCQSIVSVYNSFLFREEPDREFGSIKYLPELEEFLKDADQDGRSLNAFMKDVATWASVFGHCWIIVAKPDVGAVTRADEQALGVRPYVNLLTPMVVLDWSWKRSASGRYSLDYFKYLEESNGSLRTIKEWTVETITTTTVDLDLNVFTEQIVEVNGLGYIPAVCAYNGRSTIRGIGVSDITDIADQQRFIYDATSEMYDSIRLDSHPSLVVTPECQVGTGAGAIIKMPENMDAGLKPYVLDFSGASVDSIKTAISMAVDAIDKMANTGSIRSTEARRMSGVAQQQEFELLNARLSEKADQMELAEENMWKIWCDYMGYIWDGAIDYPGSFNIRDTQDEIDQLVKAKQAATNPKVFNIIDGRIVELLGEEEDVIFAEDMAGAAEGLPAEAPFEPHIMKDPESGKEYIARTEQEHLDYAAMGYVHED